MNVFVLVIYRVLVLLKRERLGKTCRWMSFLDESLLLIGLEMNHSESKDRSQQLRGPGIGQKKNRMKIS